MFNSSDLDSKPHGHVERSEIYRPPSLDHQFFGGSSLGTLPPSDFSFSFRTDASSFGLSQSERRDSVFSVASNFSSMTDDELADDADVRLWALDSDGNEDCAFSSGLADACTYYATRPEEVDDGADVENAESSTLPEDFVAAEYTENEDNGVSDAETEAEDDEEPSPPCASMLQPTIESQLSAQIDFELYSGWRPGSWAPVPPTASPTRRSTRAASRTKPASASAPPTSSAGTAKRKRPQTRIAASTPSKKVAFVGREGKPTSIPLSKPKTESARGTPQAPAKLQSTLEARPRTKRIILRV